MIFVAWTKLLPLTSAMMIISLIFTIRVLLRLLIVFISSLITLLVVFIILILRERSSCVFYPSRIIGIVLVFTTIDVILFPTILMTQHVIGLVYQLKELLVAFTGIWMRLFSHCVKTLFYLNQSGCLLYF